jgi:hypothetical protein
MKAPKAMSHRLFAVGIQLEDDAEAECTAAKVVP